MNTDDIDAEQESSEPEAPIYETVEKITPGSNDKSWWIKWVASIFIIIGAMLTAAISTLGVDAGSSIIFGWNIGFSFIGLILWSYVGMLWHDNSIIVMNVFLAGVFSLSIIQLFL